MTHTRASGGSHKHRFPGAPSSGTFDATRQKGLEDPVGPVSCLRPLRLPLCCLPPNPAQVWASLKTPPPLDQVLLSANPCLIPGRMAGDAEPPPWGLGDVKRLMSTPDRAYN